MKPFAFDIGSPFSSIIASSLQVKKQEKDREKKRNLKAIFPTG